MRTEIFLSFITIAMAFVSGALILSVRQAPSMKLAGPVLAQEISRFSKENLSKGIFRMDNFRDIIDPNNLLPSYHKYSYREVKALENYRQTCQLIGSKRSEDLKKLGFGKSPVVER